MDWKRIWQNLDKKGSWDVSESLRGVRGGGEYEQNVLCEIWKELIKIKNNIHLGQVGKEKDSSIYAKMNIQMT